MAGHFASRGGPLFRLAGLLSFVPWAVPALLTDTSLLLLP